MKSVTIRKIVINKDNLKKFQPIWTCKSKKHVKGLLDFLKTNQCFDTPLIANLVRNKYRIMDGKYRLEAVKQYLQGDPNGKIPI